MIESAADIIAALRSIIADYEQRSAIQPDVDRTAPAAPPSPQPPAGAVTPSIEDRARKMALRGREEFLPWYGKLDDDQRKRVQTIAEEIKEKLAKAAIAKAKGE